MKLAIVALSAIFLFALSTGAQSLQPNFVALDMAGNRVDLSQLRGKVVVINLWFIGCPNCMDEIKQLNELVGEYKGKPDVVFLGLASSQKPALEKFLVTNPFNYTILPNAQMIILTKFGSPDKNGEINVPFPMHYVIDREGKIVVKEQGIKGVDAVRNELKKQVK
ncbi:MAG: peroxiredoxin family protein [Pyrinomonadaceae bacterium]